MTETSSFTEHFGAPEPSFEVSVPGRVNLIGEHIDYAGLSVLPMAVQRRVALTVRPREDAAICVVNTDGRFERVEFAVGRDIPPYPAGHWGNYVKAAVQHLERRYGGMRGFDAVVRSDLPPAMGLSSSSALVVAVGLGTATAARRVIPPLELAHELAEAERYVGTRGGGMDQAICVVAQAGHAARIDFDPLRESAVPVPSGWRFIIASSLTSAEKSGRVQAEYNRRRQDVEAAVDAVGVALGRPGDSLRGLMQHHATETLVDAGGRVLAPEVLARFRHVVREADRVHRAERALGADDPVTFGQLMLQSHASLRDDFAVSSAELDAIVEVGARAGADGARLTGAGFGGCAVLLANAETAQGVCRALREQFYAPNQVTDVSDCLFVAEPSAGAQVRSLRQSAEEPSGEAHPREGPE